MRYYIFRRNAEGDLGYSESSMALGDGPRELDYIRAAHGLGVGDLIYINDTFHLVDVGEILPLHSLSESIVNGELWSVETENHLRALLPQGRSR